MNENQAYYCEAYSKQIFRKVVSYWRQSFTGVTILSKLRIELISHTYVIGLIFICFPEREISI